MSQNITIRLTPEEKAELERLNAAHGEASLAARRTCCAVRNYRHCVLERAFSDMPAAPGYPGEYCLAMHTLTADSTVEAIHIWEGIPPDKGTIQ